MLFFKKIMDAMFSVFPLLSNEPDEIRPIQGGPARLCKTCPVLWDLSDSYRG